MADGRRTSLLTGNPELPPVSVEPSVGSVAPGATQELSVRFSPWEVAQSQGRLVSRYGKSDD